MALETWPCSHYSWMESECRKEHTANVEAMCRNCLRNEVTRLTQERDALQAENARLKANARAVREKVTTVLVEREWQVLMRWRDLFLSPDDDEPGTLCAPDNQLVCYAIADAMTLRDVDKTLDSLEISQKESNA